MTESENRGKKILVTMIGANNAIDTEYAFFESLINNDNEESVYQKIDDGADGSKREKYGYPFFARIKAITNEKRFDQIVFIGTQASKWESLLANAERLASNTQGDKADNKKNPTEAGEKSYNAEVLEQMNQYVSHFIGNGYNPVTVKELAKIEGYISDLLTPETIKQEKKEKKENEEQKKHTIYMQEHLSAEHLHDYEIQLGRSITLAVKKTDDSEVSPIEVKVILIKEGRTESENRENVIKIQQELASIPISEITLDVTNGLRSHPMYVLAVINNISAIENKGIPVNIYYGMFDAKLKAQAGSKGNNYIVPINPRDGEVAPMVDLKEIQTMNKWTRAISEFFSNGSVLQIIELLDAIRKEDEKTRHEKIDNYIQAFENFSLAVNSNNLLIFEKAMKKIDLMKKNIRSAKNGEKDEIPKYIQICLDQIILHIWNQFKIEDAEEQTKYSYYMFALADWYLQQNRLGDSVRTFQEAVITYVMEKYPKKISKLLEKRMIQWPFKNKHLSDVMFDAKVRKVVRDAIFEDDFKIKGREEEYQDWAEWVQEYHYMKEHIHNPDALLYNFDQKVEDTTKEGIATSANDIKYVKKNIENFAKKMPGRNRKGEVDFSIVKYNMLEKRINYLLDIRYNDVFISYRRSYHSDDGHLLNDGVLLVTALSDYFRNKGLKVFVDKNKMRGVQGEFSPYLQQNLRNSKLCLVVLGKDAFARDYAETDEYYKEIITAVKKDMKIAVICMEDFYKDGGSEINYGKNVKNQKELMKVINDLQRVGSEYADRWRYENILSLRKCAYEEIKKMLEEE